ncbi:MAG: glutamate 5-kinase [Kofleriaceae bacterium]|nr:glutamate 5-kinase [Candidatus Methylomirabilis lanthanidiphila]
MPDARAVARETKRIVVKVGSAVLSKGDITLHQPTLQRICRELVSLRKEGHQVVLVSSGAILAGMGRLGLTERPGSIPLKQAAAAVGQSLLMRRYEEVFAPYGQKLGQLLLTQDDFRSRHRYLNARNTLFTLLHLGVLPIINENDTVAVEEIRFGDNDRLSALVATLLGADLLVILTDLDGLYTADPRKDPHARLVHEVPRRSTGLHFWADESGTGLGTGGMATKVRAARTAAAAGVPTIIANGLVEGILERIIRGETVGTVFQASASRMRSRKRWLAFATTRRGRIMVDAGAKEALIRNGKSLLPSGVISVDGEFEGGDVVSLCSIDGVEFARGVTNYNAEQVKQIRGIRSDQIEDALGEKPFDEVVHRDNLVILA